MFLLRCIERAFLIASQTFLLLSLMVNPIPLIMHPEISLLSFDLEWQNQPGIRLYQKESIPYGQ